MSGCFLLDKLPFLYSNPYLYNVINRSQLKQLIREVVEELDKPELYFFRKVEMQRTYKKDAKFFGSVTPKGTVEKFFIGDANVEVPAGSNESVIKQAIQQKYGRNTDTVEETVETFSVMYKGEEARDYMRSRASDYDRLHHIGG